MIQTNTTFAITLCEVVVYFLMQNYNCHHCKDHPGKKVRRDPANPAWDPRFVPGGIPTGILEALTWDPALNPRWDPANPTRDPSYILDKIPHGIWPQIPGGIPPIPPGIPALFHAKSRQSHLATYVFPGWDPANPTWDPKFVPCEIPGGIPQSHLGLTCL